MRYIGLLTLLALAISHASSSSTAPKVPKQTDKQLYVHLMPWFETPASNGAWGQHWTMNNQNPDIIVGENDKRQIAAYYYPEFGPYASGDGALIDYQIQMMRYAGVDGVLIDWPGTTQAWDYPKNMQNADAFISRLEANGMTFAIVYEDHNLGLAQEGGFITDIIGQGKNDMAWLRDNYFGRGNYIRVNGAPLLMTFGPQTLTNPGDWQQLFQDLPEKPTFLTLWYQQEQAAGSASGEYPWIYQDFYDGLRNFYTNHPLNVKFGVAYPGFNTFYAEGGWGGPGWSLPVGTDTFAQTLQLALDAGDVNMIQAATWNDWGEGTMIEPSREFGNGFLNILQNALKVPYGDRELNLIKELYRMRIEGGWSKEAVEKMNAVNEALRNLQPDLAAEMLGSIKK